MNIPFLLSPKINISYIDWGSTLRQGIERFRLYGYTALPVLDKDGFYMGTVTEGDFLRFITDFDGITRKDLESVRIKEIIRADFNPPLKIDDSLEMLADRLMDSNFVPIVDGRGCFVGIVTRKSLLSYLRRKLASEYIEMSGLENK